MYKLLFVYALVYALTLNIVSAEFSGLYTILNYFGISTNKNDNNNNNNIPKDTALMSPEELGVSSGRCPYSFQDYALYRDRFACVPDDKYILHLMSSRQVEVTRKPPILLKCLQPDIVDNATSYDNALLMMTNIKDIVQLLKPVGNATKRHEPGSCVLIQFCTTTSLGCATAAPGINMLPHQFPTLRVAYIDAFKFPSFNAEFGIVGLPTLLLFHQGRPIVKFYNDGTTFEGFVTRHTGIKQMKPVPSLQDMSGPLPLAPVQEPDYYLVIAWAFIVLCMINYARRTIFWKQIVEMVQRNWRESEETQMAE